jgi:Phosphotransferase enzyme family
VSPGSVVRRNAFLLFEEGAREPELVVKFSRVPGESWQFDREERGLSLALEAGGAVASHAPRQLGRTEVRGHHLSVETAGTGTKLTTLLRLPGSRRRKAAVLDSIAAWIVRVARETAAPPEALRPELERLTREVLPLWADRGVDPGLAEALPPLPAAFQHNDVAEENVIVRGDGFTIIDWEWVRPRYLPVTDTVYFAARVLRLLDGALLEEERDPHFEALFSGRAPSSPILFRWLRELVRALEIPAEAVGPLVTLTWLDQATASDRERRKAEEASGRQIPPDYMERSAATWLRNPALGPAWKAWREAG